MCDETLNMADPNAGTLVSVSRPVKNSAWVAVQGGEFAIHGNLGDQDRVDSVAYQSVYAEALKRGLFENLKVEASWRKEAVKKGLRIEDYMTLESLGTDYAVDFARTSFCHHFPMTREQMAEAVNYLNQLNEPFNLEKKKYNWLLFENNCEHLVNNTLASTGVKRLIPTTNRMFPFIGVLIGLVKVMPPAGGFIQHAREALHLFDDMDVKRAFRNEWIRKSFEANGTPPVTHGRFISVSPMRTQGNEFYDTKASLFALSLFPRHNKFAKIVTDPRLRNLEIGLKDFRAKYQALKERHLPLEEVYRKSSRLRKENFASFYEIYTQWLDRSILEVDELLGKFNPVATQKKPESISQSEAELNPAFQESELSAHSQEK